MRAFTLIILLLPLMGLSTAAQNYTLLATDYSGDAMNSVGDIKSFSYRMDAANDSIWFKIETYDVIAPGSPDIGFMLGLDTNLQLSDGFKWTPGTTPMQYDHALFVVQKATPPYFAGRLGIPGQNSPIAVSLARPDNYTFIINTSLTTLDNDSNFNIILGTGAADIITTGYADDDAPDADYSTISVIHKDISTSLVYPFANQTVVSNEPFLVMARIKNEGSESIEPGNILQRTITIAGQTFIDSPSHPYLYQGNTFDLQQPHFSVNIIKDELAAMCVDVRVMGYTDPNVQNNKDCKMVNVQMFPTRVNDVSVANGIIVYPATAEHCIYIQGNSPNAVFSLYDLAGKLITKQILLTGKNAVSTLGISPGLYLYTITMPDGSINKGKIVTNR